MNTFIPHTITKYYERLDQICVRRYGSSADDVVVHVLNANPGLEKYDILLPDGLKILLPDLPASAVTTTVRENTYLWN
ncbi:tail protein X [Methylobacterium brachiatum]|uniref:tail protein X n=1 Tax=Methylobacterium brachiatum TaxID=269660 RepID=UPI000EFCF485|nr:tail protein X [Methylobacterium brachiatum]AYO84051.1 phage tail protein [Methylobacterium brachiatum]